MTDQKELEKMRKLIAKADKSMGVHYIRVPLTVVKIWYKIMKKVVDK